MLKKLYISFCYIINFLLCLSFTLTLLIKLISFFFNNAYLTYIVEINLILLVLCTIFTTFLLKKFYTPTTKFIFSS